MKRRIQTTCLTIFTFLFLTIMFLAGCSDGKDGENGVAGVTGVGGCDYNQMFDKELGFCVPNPDYKAPKDGGKGDPGGTGGKGEKGDTGKGEKGDPGLSATAAMAYSFLLHHVGNYPSGANIYGSGNIENVFSDPIKIRITNGEYIRLKVNGVDLSGRGQFPLVNFTAKITQVFGSKQPSMEGVLLTIN